MKILIIHAYSPANIGDGAIVLAMISEARRVFGDAVEVRVSATDPEAFEEFLGIRSHGRLVPWHSMGSIGGRLKWLVRNLPTILLLWWGSGNGRKMLARLSRSRFLPSSTRVAVSAYLEVDLVLACGGGYLGDTYRRQLPFWHLEYRCAAAAGLPLIFFSQSMGSTNDPVTKFFLRKALAQCAVFIARDRQTVERVAMLGPFESKVALYPDAALLVERPDRDDLVRADAPCVGVSLMRWSNYREDRETGHAAYLAGMQRALEGLLVLHPGLRVRLYATNVAFGANPMDDVGVVVEMHRRLSEGGLADRCEAIEWTPIPDVFMRSVSQCELFVATRMHSAVLALNVGVPVAGVAYEEKMRGLLETFELGDYVADIESPEAIPELVLRAYDRRGELRKTVARVAPGIRARASLAMDLTARVVASAGTIPEAGAAKS
jgi:colanic acid/amylovoran biosynthesis protein